MNILLDTHIAIWAIANDPRLSARARELLLDPYNNIYLSAISTLEVSNKCKSKKNNLAFNTRQFVEYCQAAGFLHLPLKSEHFFAEAELHWGGSGKIHRDPYDRLLLAQAKSERLRFMTHDQMIQLFDEKCIIPV